MCPSRLEAATFLLLAATAPAQQQPPPQLQPKDCALLVVSTGLAKHGAADLRLLYEFVQKAGAALPHQQLAECYAEIADVGDEDGTPAGIVAALDKLGRKYKAVDLIVHAHGQPFELVCSDGAVDVVELALCANAELAKRAAAAWDRSGVDLELQTAPKQLLCAVGGGGFGFDSVPRSRAACRFRVLPAKGEVQDGARVRVASRTGHYWRRDGEQLLADASFEAATEFVLRANSKVGTGAQVRFEPEAADGDRTRPTDAATYTARLLPPLGATKLQVQPLAAAAIAHLRCALTTSCYGASAAPALLNLGFRAAAGSRGVSADSASSFPAFLHYWALGDSFAEAIAAANRSDPLGAQDRIAGARFRGVDSQRVLFGDGELDRRSPCGR